MSKMELRSSRSRSRTPFMSEEFEASANGKHVEKVMTRTTRRTTVVKTNEFASSSTDEVTSKDTSKSSRKSMAKSEKSLRNHLLKSSNYSFEDGENEVSSSKTIRQNERNQLLEDASNLNGSESPALDLYRRSGRYWEIYPKTDWTYSQHSKDRVEIAPGVVAMPNMSRKTIHNLDESSHESYEFLKKRYSENMSHKTVDTKDLYSNYTRESEDYFIKRRKQTRWSLFREKITTIFTTIFSVFTTTYFYVWKMQTSVFSQIHRVASKVMLWDTYLLWKSGSGDKGKKLAWLCLVPLLLFGGIIVFSLKTHTSWKHRHPSMHSDPYAGFFKVNDIAISAPLNIASIALGPRLQTSNGSISISEDREVYYSPISSLHLYSVKSSLLRRENSTLEIQDHGLKSSQSVGMIMDNKGVMYYSLLSSNSVAKWNTSDSFQTGQKIIAKDPRYLEWVNSFTFNDKGNLTLLVNRLNRFIFNEVNISEPNFHLITSHVEGQSYLNDGYLNYITITPTTTSTTEKAIPGLKPGTDQDPYLAPEPQSTEAPSSSTAVKVGLVALVSLVFMVC